MIEFCPNCGAKLDNSKKLAQGVKICYGCGGRYFILETTAPIEISKLDGMDRTKPLGKFRTLTKEEVENDRSTAYEYLI